MTRRQLLANRYLAVGFGTVVALASAFLSRDDIQAAISGAALACAIALPTVGGMLMIVPSATLVSGLLLASTMVGALLVHIFVIGLGVQTVVIFALLSGIFAVMWHHRNR